MLDLCEMGEVLETDDYEDIIGKSNSVVFKSMKPTPVPTPVPPEPTPVPPMAEECPPEPTPPV
jgi:hypothetical protein